MNKDEMVDAIMKDTGIKTKTTAERALDSMLNAITEGLQKDGAVFIPPFGKFKTVDRNARMGRNPQTGEELEIPAKTVARFISSKQLKQEIQDPEEE
jgi:nucleoid DNA-binding protein